MNSSGSRCMHLLRRPSGALLAVLLLALFGRALVAPGFMPRLGADGIGIVLCTPQGARLVQASGDPAPQHPAAAGEHCAFALALGLAALPPAPPPLLPPRARTAVLAETTLSFAAPRRARGAVSARGPPAEA